MLKGLIYMVCQGQVIFLTMFKQDNRILIYTIVPTVRLLRILVSKYNFKAPELHTYNTGM